MGVFILLYIQLYHNFLHHQHVQDALAESYTMDGDIWDATSEAAKDFVRGLLRADPEKRVKIEDLAKNPWLLGQQCPVDLKGSNKALEILENIRLCGNRSLCSTICSTAIAKHLDHKDLQSIHEAFADWT